MEHINIIGEVKINLLNIGKRKIELTYKNTLTDEGKYSLLKNLVTSDAENKIYGVIISNKKFTMSSGISLNDIKTEPDTRYYIIPLTSTSMIGSGVFKYGMNIDFTFTNNDDDIDILTMGLVLGTGVDKKLLTVLNTSFTVNHNGTFNGNYTLSILKKK